MRPVTVTRTVPQAPEEVFAFLDVMANHERFTNHYMTDWSYSGPDRGVGSKAHMTVSLGGRKTHGEVEVVSADRPREIVEENRTDDGKRRGRGTYRLEPAPGGGTVIAFEYALLEAPLADRLAGPIASRLLTKANTRVLERLEEELSRPAPG